MPKRLSKQQRRSRRLAGRSPVHNGANISQVLGVTPKAKAHEDMAAATALDRAEAAAMQHDLATLSSKIMQRRRQRRARSSIGSRRSSLGTPHASRLDWTSEDDGTDADAEGELPDVAEAEEPEDEGADAEIEPRSPPEAPRPSDEEFIVDDYDPAEGDETYVQSATDEEEDEEHELTLMLSTLTLTSRQRKVLTSRISTIRKHRVNRKLWAKYPAIEDTPAPIERRRGTKKLAFRPKI